MLSKLNFKLFVGVCAASILTLGSGLTANAQSNTATSRGDTLMLDMNQAYRSGDQKKLTQLLPQLKGHALEPWAAYWELKARLEEANPAEVDNFIQRFTGSYQEDRLRNDWLLLLGQRRDWAGFAAMHPQFRMGDDREVRCYALQIEQQQAPTNTANNKRIAQEVKSNWLAQRDADDGCSNAAARLFEAKALTADDIWLKARLATESNRARAVSDAVAIVAPESLGLVSELFASPIKFLATKKIAIRKTRKEIIVLALIRLAATDSDSAAQMMDSKWGIQLSSEERNWVWGLIGMQAANRMGRVPGIEALGFYAKVSKDSDLNDEMLGWKARAALRAGDQPNWRLVLSSINAMTLTERLDPTWVYWKARALMALPADKSVTPAGMPAQRAEGLALLQSIASGQGFYEQLALEELGQLISVPPRPAPLTTAEKEAARLHPGLNRAAYAIAIGLRSEGVREWNYSTNLAQPGGMPERAVLAAAQFACDRQIWDRCINTSERSTVEIDFEQRYPMPFHDAVIKRAKAIDLDPAFVYGLIRQESRFIMDARSGVGASGLMQVMPATAKETARRLGMTGFTASQITDRDTNIAIGTGYLKMVLDDMSGSMAMAAAGYNAGPGRPRLWRGKTGDPALEAAIWAENVPFHETRNYVKKVLSNTTNYAALITGKPQSLKSRLGSIGPRDLNLTAADTSLP
jgi:soluble lytic murein transglycosylase